MTDAQSPEEPPAAEPPPTPVIPGSALAVSVDALVRTDPTLTVGPMVGVPAAGGNEKSSTGAVSEPLMAPA